ncbi:MAG: MFS transporter [Synergistaceae bacterium]|nr:MFS transporter [Synergistaceae bacterium]
MDSSSVRNDKRAVSGKNKRTLLGVIFLHGLNDMHSTALPTVIPMLAQSISLTLSQAGFLNALFGITNLFGQPVSGYVADKLKRPWLAVWGPLLSVSGAALLPLSPSYGAAFIFVGMMSAGTALFHPQGTGRCGAAAGGGALAFYLSLFQASGTFGSAIGPIYVVFMISILGKPGFPAAIIPAVALLCLYIWRQMGASAEEKVRDMESSPRPHFFENLRYLVSKVGWIVSITSVRDAVFQSIKIFLPMLLITRGSSIAAGGMTLFAVTLSATLAGIAGGKLADMIGDEKVLLWALAIAPFFLIVGLHDSSFFCLLSLMAGFAFLQASTPVTTAMAQRRCPDSRSMVSSLSNGVSWGIANLFVTPVGIIADAVGLQATLNVVAFLPWTVALWYGGRKLIKRRRG